MSGLPNSKLGPIPEEHFENDPVPEGTAQGRWSQEQQEAFDKETERLRELTRNKGKS